MKTLFKLFFIAMLAILIASCNSSSIHSEDVEDLEKKTSWKFEDEQFTYFVHYKTLPYPGDSNSFRKQVDEIAIYSNILDSRIQIITPIPYLCDDPLDSSAVFIVEDVNFDGQKDIRLISWLSNYNDKEYWYWIYNEEQGQFETDKNMIHFMNPEFDIEHQFVYTQWRVGVMEQGHSLYKWEDAHYQLLVEQVQSLGFDPSFPSYLETFKLVSGEKKCKGEDIPSFIEMNKEGLLELLENDIETKEFKLCLDYQTQQ